MNLMEMLQRIFNEQKWRESKAQNLSSGLGSMPYSFDETMDLKYPGVINRNRRYDEEEERRRKLMESTGKGLGSMPTTNFLDYYRQKEVIDDRQKRLADIFKQM